MRSRSVGRSADSDLHRPEPHLGEALRLTDERLGGIAEPEAGRCVGVDPVGDRTPHAVERKPDRLAAASHTAVSIAEKPATVTPLCPVGLIAPQTSAQIRPASKTERPMANWASPFTISSNARMRAPSIVKQKPSPVTPSAVRP